ncbi:MAG: RNA polymerase factor sigma-54 [Stagnimonas sp.]|nr:RNA polymerase factor sigma-54 [Stagnimonas sp.]
MKPNLKLHVSQQMSLSPQLVQSIRLLQLSAQELEQEVATALESNPLLDNEPEPQAAEQVALLAGEAALVGEHVAQIAETPLEAVAAPADDSRYEVDIDDSFAVSEAWSAAGGEGDDEDHPLRQAVAPSAGLRARLEAELAAEIHDPEQARAVVAILEQVDDAGYLRASGETLAATTGLALSVLRKALAHIRRLAPTGFAARDLRECLLLQLAEVRVGTPGRNLAERLVMDHLPELASRDREALRLRLGASPEQFAAARELIRGLDPKPGLEPEQEGSRYVTPDLLISGSPGAWKVELNPATLPRVRLNRLYEQVLANGGGRGLKDKLNEARWLVRGLEMRHETLLKTARVIFERQSEFLRRGEIAMKPLTLREVAQAIEMHESTVSRVTTAKFVLTPWGLFELKHFFSVSLAGGQAESSGVAVRAMIRQLVDTENPAMPLCDGAISAILARQGVQVARRTVAKYREAMKIAAAPDRKQPAVRDGRSTIAR